MDLTAQFRRNAATIHDRAVQSLFAALDEVCEGAIAVDAQARIVWINDKYRALLGLDLSEPVLGRDIETLIPTSRMREVAESGRPILLDIMEVNDNTFVVTRLPLTDEAGACIGAVGFVIYERPELLRPLISKYDRLQKDLARAQRELDAARRAKYSFRSFVGNHASVLEVKRQARRAARLDAGVLLLGETGTGKELLAHAIHAASDRAMAPFVGVNLAAVPENLLEAEFFGAAPGAYTGADPKGRKGRFEIADRGTLFLDEVGDMPQHLQAKLLRVLQEREVEPLGSNRVIRVDVRVIAATSLDLEKLVEEGKFRSDLYYRLNVLPTRIPPLRERLSDLEALCEVLLANVAERAGERPRDIAADAIETPALHHWPGNVRELRNVIERVVALTDHGELGAEDFAAVLPKPRSGDKTAAAAVASGVRPLDELVAETERNAIRAALAATKGRKAPAARLLGISRAKLYDKMGRHGILSD